VSAPVTVTVDGEPVPKGRARVGKHGTVFTPKRTRAFEAVVRQLAALEMRGRQPLQGPLRVDLLVQIAIPSSWPMTRRLAALAGELLPTGRPDLDNFLKSVDALNGIVFGDDAQVVEVCARKRYGLPTLVVVVADFDIGESS
jgi:Holliday junction resolvase RusA-like endonuclease